MLGAGLALVLLAWAIDASEVGGLPFVVTTWNYEEATSAAWDVLRDGRGSALDAVEAGCGFCEEVPEVCGDSVGFGGRSDEAGETTLDAMIMDGTLHRAGAVGALRRVKRAISVARKVMENTEHTLLVGEQATGFAVQLGFADEDLTTTLSAELHEGWLNGSCQPNSWRGVEPDPRLSCGPYRLAGGAGPQRPSTEEGGADVQNHDTIGMIALDSRGRMAVGTSTNGLRYKIPGRVGDSPIPGSGAYVDRSVGGAVATGNGDVMMRFAPTYETVERMRSGLTPAEAAEAALRRITDLYPHFGGAVLAASTSGEFGASCYGFNGFSFTVGNGTSVEVMRVSCFT